MFRKIKLELAQAQSSDRITARAHCARCARENRWRIAPMVSSTASTPVLSTTASSRMRARVSAVQDASWIKCPEASPRGARARARHGAPRAIAVRVLRPARRARRARARVGDGIRRAVRLARGLGARGGERPPDNRRLARARAARARDGVRARVRTEAMHRRVRWRRRRAERSAD